MRHTRTHSTEQRCRPKYPIDVVVRERVVGACQSPFHDVFRKECTRHEAQLIRARWQRTGGSSRDAMRGNVIEESSGGRLIFARDFDLVRTVDVEVPPLRPEVLIVGGSGFFAKFIAEECAKRNISVTVLTRCREASTKVFLPIFDKSRSARHEKSKGYISLNSVASQLIQESLEEFPGGSEVSYEFLAKERCSDARERVSLRIIEGSHVDEATMQRAARQSAVIFFLASAKGNFHWSDFLRPSICTSVDVEGLKVAAFCAVLVDAHLVTFTPRLAHGKLTSLTYWWNRCMTNRWGYFKAAEMKERILLEERGESALPQSLSDFGLTLPCRESRFTLFRTDSIVYPSFNRNIVVEKNNCIADPFHCRKIGGGNIDAALLARTVMQALGLSRAIISSRIDICGSRRDGVDCQQVGNVIRLFDGLRNEC